MSSVTSTEGIAGVRGAPAAPPDSRHVTHIALMVADLQRSRRFYREALGLLHSGTAGVGEDAINVITSTAICFMSFGRQHHDLNFFMHVDPKSGEAIPPGPGDLHHLCLDLRPEVSLGDAKTHLAGLGIKVHGGPALPDPTGTFTPANTIWFADPDGHLIELYAPEVR